LSERGFEFEQGDFARSERVQID